MAITIIINSVAIFLIPGLFFWITKNIPSLYSQLSTYILLLCTIHLYKTYGFSDDLVFANAALTMVLVLALVDLLITFSSSNKRIKVKKIKAKYEGQRVLKVLPLKFKIMEFLEIYTMLLGLIFTGSFFILGISATTNSMRLTTSQLLDVPVQIDGSTLIHWYLLGTAVIGAVLSAVLYFVVKNIKKKMLPVFWRAQLLPVFNPESEIYERITEITDKEYLRQIFEVNDFLLIEADIDRVEQHNKNLNYIMQNYPLNILNIQHKLYINATSIGVNEINGEFHVYFLKIKKVDQSPPPASKNKEEKAPEKTSVTGEVANAV